MHSYDPKDPVFRQCLDARICTSLILCRFQVGGTIPIYRCLWQSLSRCDL